MSTKLLETCRGFK